MEKFYWLVSVQVPSIGRVSMADALMKAGEFDAAASVAATMASDAELRFGPCHEETLHFTELMGLCQYIKGDLGKALDTLGRASRGSDRTLGENSPDSLRRASNFACTLLGSGDAVRALELFARVLEQEKESPDGSSDVSRMSCVNNHACARAELGDYDYAAECFGTLADMWRLRGEPSFENCARMNLEETLLRRNNRPLM